MIKELKYMNIEYSEKDLDYIDLICEDIENISEELVEFFGIQEFGEKVNVKLYDTLESFRKNYLEITSKLYGETECEDWVCGFSPDETNIYTLCLEEYKKTKSHEDNDINDLKYLILHEFTHSVHHKFGKKNDECYMWLGEGIACVLSHQYDLFEIERPFDVSLEKICFGNCSYNYYRTMFKYVLENYGRDYVLKLLSDYDFLKEETPKLYEEIKKEYSMNR